MRLTKNFSLDEFNRRGFDLTPAIEKNLTELANQLQALRDHFGKPISIESGYRSAEHNLKIGGALKSFHVTGQAADIKVEGITPQQVFDAIEALIKAGKMKEGGLGLYNTWVHYDTRGKRIRWDKRK